MSNIFFSNTPHVMGILNVTPDSFSDGGLHNTRDKATKYALQMIEAGATIIDIGGESTRPGALEVSEDEELERVVPVIEQLRNCTDVLLSVDTSKPAVMLEAVAAGADIINDVRALTQSNALETAASLNVPVCLMHMRGTPKTMQEAPNYDNVVDEVIDFLLSRVEACENVGIAKDKIILDPGYGFGKTLDHNFQLVSDFPRLLALGFPVLVGVSRKSMVGQVVNRPADQRLAGSLALATVLAMMGAQILRVHDVAETRDVVQVVNKIKQLQNV